MLLSFPVLVGKHVIVMFVGSAFHRWTRLLSALVGPPLLHEILMCGRGKREVK